VSLDEDAQALTIRQKQICIADQLALRWAMVKHYQTEDRPEDEKEISQSEKMLGRSGEG